MGPKLARGRMIVRDISYSLDALRAVPATKERWNV